MFDSWRLLVGFLPWQVLIGILALIIFFSFFIVIGALLSQCIVINGGIVGVETGDIV